MGNRAEQAVAASFLAQLEEKLRVEWDAARTHDPNLKPAVGVAPPPSAPASALATANNVGSILYTTEQYVAAASNARILRLTLRDRGAGARVRYNAVISYNTVTGDYVGPLLADASSTLPHRVTVSRDMENLAVQESFVDDLVRALAPANLRRTDAPDAATVYREIEATEDDVANASTLVANQRRILFDAQAHCRNLAQLVSTSNFNPRLNDELTQANEAAAHARLDLYATTESLSDAETHKQNAIAAARAAITAAITANDVVAEPDKLFSVALAKMYTSMAVAQAHSPETPMAGVMEIKAQVQARTDANDLDSPAATFVTDSVQIVVEDGNVEELKAVGRLGSESVLFETYAPIGISSDRDLRRSWPRQLLWTQTPPAGFGGHAAVINLADLLHYTANMQANGKDRSPADGVYTLHPGDGLAQRSLPKLTTTKLLQARVFTDAAGFSDANKPNGLIQVEVDKKLEWGVPWSKSWQAVQFRLPAYFTPLVAITKIEQQNRFLPLERVPNEPLRYTINTIDLLRYTNLRVGGDFNLGGMRWAALKSDFYLDASIYLNRVDMRDSVRRPNAAKLVRVDSTLNVVMYGIGLKTRFRPDSRYGVQSRIGFYRYALVNDLDQNNKLLIEQRPNIKGLYAEAHTQLDKYIYQGVFQYELLFWASLSTSSKVFFRPQFSHLLYQANHTFFQFQVGYQFDVFSNTREDKIPVKKLW